MLNCSIAEATYPIQLEDAQGVTLLNCISSGSKARWIETLKKATSDYQKQRFRRLSFDKAKYGRKKQLAMNRLEQETSSLKEKADTESHEGNLPELKALSRSPDLVCCSDSLRNV